MRVLGLSLGFSSLVGFFSFADGGLLLMDLVGRGVVGLESMSLWIVGTAFVRLAIVRMGCVRLRFVSLGLRCLELGGLDFAGFDFFGWHFASLEFERPIFSDCFRCLAKSFMVNPILLLARYTTVSCGSY